MKENNLNRVIGWSGLLLTSLLSTSALADNIGTSAEELGLSDYRHFVIYPRLDKALKAQKNNDEATAIREFEYIHQQVPDNIPLTLYLAEAYRHFGHDDRARLLLEDQLKRHPGDARLERSLAAIPVEVKSVTTVEELLAQQKACDAAPTCVVAVKSGRMPAAGTITCRQSATERCDVCCIARRKNAANRSAATGNLPETMVPGRYAIQ